MVAGSEMNYDLQLVCSNDYSCDTPSGACDCVGGDIQTYHVPVGAGRASRGDVIDEEAIFNIRDSKVRYDKAILRWVSDHSDKSKETICKIKEQGGEPPAFCQLDIAEGRYRCELGFDKADYARFYSDPVTLKNENFAGENINVDLKIAQRQPSEVEKGREINQYTKFLQFQVFNQNGVEVDVSQAYPLNGNGVHEFTTFPNYRLEETDFKLQKARVLAAGSIVDEAQIHGAGLAPAVTDFFIVFKDAETYELRTDPADGETVIGTGKIRYFGTTPYIRDDNSYYIQLRREPKAGDQISVSFKGTGEEQCTTDLEKWKMIVSLYEKEPSVDEPSGQLVNYEGNPQQKTIDLKVRCRQPADYGPQWCEYGDRLTSECKCGTPALICSPSTQERPSYCNYYPDGSYKCETEDKGISTELGLNQVLLIHNTTTEEIERGKTYSVGEASLTFKVSGSPKNVAVTQKGEPWDTTFQDGTYATEKIAVDEAKQIRITLTAADDQQTIFSFTLR
jgi:hypothetical protein